MVRRIKITTPSIGTVKAKLEDQNNPRTVEAIWDRLPIKGQANCWGDEIYFNIPVELTEEDSQQVVERGDLAYWPPGHAFCIFFGKTPASRGDEPRAYSPVNVFGKVIGDPKIFREVQSGEEIEVEKDE